MSSKSFLFLGVFLAAAFVVASAVDQCYIPGYETNKTIVLDLPTDTGSNATFWSSRIYNTTGLWILGNYVPHLVDIYWNWSNNTRDLYFKTTENFTDVLKNNPDMRQASFRLDMLCLNYNVIYNVTINVVEVEGPIDDINEHAPAFDRRAYTATVFRNSSGLSSYVDAEILVTDLDKNLQGANVVIRSSNAAINLLPQLVTASNSTGFAYKVPFIPNLKAFGNGVHEILLTADDGVHSASAYLDLTIA